MGKRLINNFLYPIRKYSSVSFSFSIVILTICIFAFFIGAIMFAAIIGMNLAADTITHKFKSPSFNGIGTSSHYLTIENQEYTRKLTIKEEISKFRYRVKSLIIKVRKRINIKNKPEKIIRLSDGKKVENLFQNGIFNPTSLLPKENDIKGIIENKDIISDFPVIIIKNNR